MMIIQYILIYLMILELFGIIKLHQHILMKILRSSAGFGIKFYSFIGPIAFTWGFPIQDESYDIKRMFTFSLGNIN